MISRLKNWFTRRRYTNNPTKIIASINENDIQFDFSFDQSSFDELVFLFLRLYSGSASQQLYQDIYKELESRGMTDEFNKMVYILQSVQGKAKNDEDEVPIVAPSRVFVDKRAQEQ